MSRSPDVWPAGIPVPEGHLRREDHEEADFERLPPNDLRRYTRLPLLTPTIRQSGLATLRQCSRKYMFTERFGLERVGFKKAASLGTMFHLGMNALYTGRLIGEAASMIRSYAENTVNDLLDWYAENPARGDIQSITSDIYENAEKAVAMTEAYTAARPLDSFFRGDVEPVAVERDFSLTVPGIKRTIGGRLDLVLRGSLVPGMEGIWITDHKATSRMPAYKNKSQFSTQVRLYRLLAAAAFPEERVFGFIYNLIRPPTIRKKRWQTSEEYVREVADWYAGRAEADPPDGKARWDHTDNALLAEVNPFVDRHLVLFTEPLLPDELLSLLKMGDRAAGCSASLTNFPRDGELTDACTDTYGSACEFLPLCTESAEDWVRIIDEGYRPRISAPPSDGPTELILTPETIQLNGAPLNV